jgi:hypothetical protein
MGREEVREDRVILQLNPAIPVFVVGANGWPEGNGRCIAFIDYSEEDFTLWKVAMDGDGSVYDVPQSHIRLQFNISMGRVKRAA